MMAAAAVGAGVAVLTAGTAAMVARGGTTAVGAGVLTLLSFAGFLLELAGKCSSMLLWNRFLDGGFFML